MKALADVSRSKRLNNSRFVETETGCLVLHEGQVFFVEDLRVKDIEEESLDWYGIERHYVYDDVDEDDGYDYRTRTRGYF